MPTLDALHISPQMRDFDQFCTSDDLSLILLQEKVNLLDESDIQHIMYIGSCLHKACMNKNVSLEIIEYLLDVFPRAVSNWCRATEFSSDSWVEEDEVDIGAYPLHCACNNEHCPSSVIKLLLERYPPALEQLCTVENGIRNYEYEGVYGLPLHYYLVRNSNIDIEIVKMMVEAYPQSLMTTGEEEDDKACYPIHALLLNGSTFNLHEILTYLIELEPSSIRMLDVNGNTPLNLAMMRNNNMNLEIFQFLYNAYPEAIRIPNILYGYLPIHELSLNSKLDDDVSLDILRFMLDIDPTLTREISGADLFPIYHAVINKSTEFCKVLINAFPESLRIGFVSSLPIHFACHRSNNVGTIQYLLDLYPESINARDERGYLPIHLAAQMGKTKTIELLLEHDPDAASKRTQSTDQRQLPLHIVCHYVYGNEEYPDTVKVLYDAYPEAIYQNDGEDIGQNRSPLDHAKRNSKTSIVNFLQDQLILLGYDVERNHLATRTSLDGNGLTLLHRALQNKAPLGTIKLLIKGNPATVRVVDNQFAFPLHIACEVSSAKIVQYLVGVSNRHIIAHLDENKDSVLYYACRGGNLGAVKYLVTNHASLVASAVVNDNGELPIHLLFEAVKDKVDVDSVEYVETIWFMLLANPEALLDQLSNLNN